MHGHTCTHMHTHMHTHAYIQYYDITCVSGYEEDGGIGGVWMEWAPHSEIPLQPVDGRGLCTDRERITTELLNLCSVRDTVHHYVVMYKNTHFKGLCVARRTYSACDLKLP